MLRQLGSRHVLVVHGEDSLDEITLTGRTRVAELKDGAVSEYLLDPREFGLNYCDISAQSQQRRRIGHPRARCAGRRNRSPAAISCC